VEDDVLELEVGLAVERGLNADSVLKYCVDTKIWHVKPNRLGYRLVRYFSQVAKKLI
jgi:hypothetical protein